MEKLKSVLDEEVKNVLHYVKSKSASYGEARKLIRDLEWGSNDELKTLISKKAIKLLEAEINELPLKK